jgi:hypothetical protein
MRGASYTSTPQDVFMAWCLVKHRDNFTLDVCHVSLMKRGQAQSIMKAGVHLTRENNSEYIERS